jgi:hypothetical protein
MFVSSRTGRIAQDLDELWHERYSHAAGGIPPSMQLPLADAMALLGVPADYTKEDVIAAFKREIKKAHPGFFLTAAPWPPRNTNAAFQEPPWNLFRETAS